MKYGPAELPWVARHRWISTSVWGSTSLAAGIPRHIAHASFPGSALPVSRRVLEQPGFAELLPSTGRRW